MLLWGVSTVGAQVSLHHILTSPSSQIVLSISWVVEQAGEREQGQILWSRDAIMVLSAV